MMAAVLLFPGRYGYILNSVGVASHPAGRGHPMFHDDAEIRNGLIR